MYRENFDFLYKMFPHHELENLDIIIVNQTTENKQLVSNIPSVNVINTFDKGLSKSRNIALKNATSGWCLIADDDLVYVEGFEKKIATGMLKYANAGVIIFQAQITKDKPMRAYPINSKEALTVKDIFHVASFEMLLNRNKLYNKVWFNTYFGLGSGIFLHGEEQVFLKEVNNLGKQIAFIKKTIVQHPLESTGRNSSTSYRYFTKGGIYAKMFPKYYLKWIFIQILIDVKQHKLALKNVYTTIKEALKGVKKLKETEDAKIKS